MSAELLIKKRDYFPKEDAFTSITVWAVDPSIRGSQHEYKYSLAYVVQGVCVMRYDNEAGKGDHKHIGDIEYPVSFSSLEDLINQFFTDVNILRR
ncbi:toxin-antitoxin system TumE family protein [Enterobacter mori]|uniref:toxin-antitoxin system TumE family protein n=1 Tax=Enterobacter mori TaxID=539813 RepID=UPI003B8434D9